MYMYMYMYISTCIPKCLAVESTVVACLELANALSYRLVRDYTINLMTVGTCYMCIVICNVVYMCIISYMYSE